MKRLCSMYAAHLVCMYYMCSVHLVCVYPPFVRVSGLQKHPLWSKTHQFLLSKVISNSFDDYVRCSGIKLYIIVLFATNEYFSRLLNTTYACSPVCSHSACLFTFNLFVHIQPIYLYQSGSGYSYSNHLGSYQVISYQLTSQWIIGLFEVNGSSLLSNCYIIKHEIWYWSVVY